MQRMIITGTKIWRGFSLIGGANVNAKDNKGNTPLHLAMSLCASEKIPSFLLDNGANVNAKNNEGDTPLNSHCDAIGYYDTEIGSVPLLLVKGASVNAENNEGNTPLHYAALSGKIELAGLLLEKRANINAENNEGNTPLHLSIASACSDNDMAAFLIDRVDINAQNKTGQTLLHFAYIKSTEIFKQLLGKGAKFSPQEIAGHEERPVRQPGQDLFDFYILHAHLSPVVISPAYSLQEKETLLAMGVNINAKRWSGETALMDLAEYNEFDEQETVFFLENGADVNAVDNKGKTALMHAVESFQDKEDYLEQLKDRVTRLINGGAEIDIQDIDGRNVLDICKSEDLKEYIRTKYDVYQSTGIGLK
jgi:ankyrin repeat protein